MKFFIQLILCSFCFALYSESLQAANHPASWYRTELSTGSPIKEGNTWQDSNGWVDDFENEQWPDAAVYLIRHIRHNISEGLHYGYDGVSGEGGNYHFFGIGNMLQRAQKLIGYTIPVSYVFPTPMNQLPGVMPRKGVPLTLDDIMPRWIKSNQFAENAVFLALPDGRDCGIHDSGTSGATDPTDPWEWQNTGWSSGSLSPAPWEMDRLAHSYLLGSFGQIGLAGGPLSGGLNQTQALIHFSVREGSNGNGHAAADTMAIALFGGGRSLFGYTGYYGARPGAVGSWHGPVNKNMAVINGDWQNKNLASSNGWNHTGGHVEICAFMPGVQVSRVDGSHIYHGGSYSKNHGEVLPNRYRRTMMLNTVDPDRAYLVDIFEIDGGVTHDYIFAGPVTRANSIPTSDLSLTQSTAFPYDLNTNLNWTDFDANRLSSGDYAADEGFSIDTGFADNPNLGDLIHVPAQGEAGKLYLGWFNDIGYYSQIAANDGDGRWHMMMHRSGTDVKSTFLTVHEVKDGSGTSFIQSIDRTPIGTDAIAITITLTDGRQDTYLVSFDGQKVMAHNGVNAEATIAVSSRSENRSDLWMVNGTTLSDANKTLTEPVGEIMGNLTQVNRTLFRSGSSDSLETDSVFPPGKVLRGQTLLVEMIENNTIKFVNSYTIDRVDALPAGSRIHLRTDPGLILTASTVEEEHFPGRKATSARIRFIPMATSVPYLVAIEPDPEAWKRIHVRKSVSAGVSGDIELTTLPVGADVRWHIGVRNAVVQQMFTIDGFSEVEFEVPNPDGLTKSRNIKKRFHTSFPPLVGALDTNNPGLVARPYTGIWNKSFDPAASYNTYNFSGASQVITGFTDGQLSLSQQKGALINGYIDIPTTGLYSFYTRFDSGAQLKIDGEILSSQLGMRSWASWKSSLYLEQGPHAIEVDTMSVNEDVDMQLYWEGPGVAYQQLPPARLYQALIQTNPAYQLRYSAGAGGFLQGALSQTVVSNASGTAVTAVASNGSHFVCWSDGVLSATRTDQGVTNHLLAKALFTANATNPQGTVPVAETQSATVLTGSSVAITLMGYDADGDSLTFALASSPAYGSLSGQIPNLIYTPHTNCARADDFTFIVNDGSLDSPEATVEIIINAAPAAVEVLLTADATNSSPSVFGGSVLNTVNDVFAYDPVNPTSALPMQAWANIAGFHAQLPDLTDAVLVYSLTNGSLMLPDGDTFAIDLYGRNMLNDRCQNIDIQLYSGGFGGTHVATVLGVAIPETSPCYRQAELTPTEAFDTVVVIGHDTTDPGGNQFTLMEIRASVLSHVCGFADWATAEGLSGDIEADFDQDGVKDLIEYGLGMDPAVDDASAAGRISLSGENTDFRFRQPIAGVNYVIEQSTDLISWSAYTAASPVQDGSDLKVTILLPPQEKIFLRLRIYE